MDHAEELKFAIYFGRHEQIERLLQDDPALSRANFGLMCALYDAEGVEAAIEKDSQIATAKVGPRSPILHLAFSRHIQGAGDQGDMLRVARALVAAGADPNDAYVAEPGTNNALSALYGAIGHSDNPVLGRFLLEAGASPDDGESLYHATELSHSHSLRLLLEFGANPAGTNALLRALDFDNAEMVAMLLAGGADPNEGVAQHPSGEQMGMFGALHQAARRGCGAEVADLLIAAGADVDAVSHGVSAYALARVHGNTEVTQALVDAGASQDLSDPETFLVAAAEGKSLPDDHVDEAALPTEYRRLLCRLAGRSGALDHIRRLVALGLDPDVADEMSLPPVHLAAWEGRLDVLEYFLTFAPDPDARNGFGGTLLATVLHGAENAPHFDGQDHASCLRQILAEGPTIDAGMDWAHLPAELREIMDAHQAG